MNGPYIHSVEPSFSKLGSVRNITVLDSIVEPTLEDLILMGGFDEGLRTGGPLSFYN